MEFTQWAVIETGKYYPAVIEFITYEEAYKYYIEQDRHYRIINPGGRVQVMLVKIEKRRKYGKKKEPQQ